MTLPPGSTPLRLALLELTKPAVSAAVGLSCLVGSFLAAGAVGPASAGAALVVIVLAGGSSALNQWQERDVDRLMERTRDRPIPSGRMSPGMALAAALGLIVVGLAALAAIAGPGPALVGVAAVVWYNGLYTSLKRVTAFAVVPGALVGVAAFAIGWLTAGGSCGEARFQALAVVLAVWQVPHFWFLAAMHGDDYRRAGLPSVTDLFRPVQLDRLKATWTCLTAMTAQLLPLFGAVRTRTAAGALALLSAWLTVEAIRLLRSSDGRTSAREPFVRINLFALGLAVVLVLDSLSVACAPEIRSSSSRGNGRQETALTSIEEAFGQVIGDRRRALAVAGMRWRQTRWPGDGRYTAAAGGYALSGAPEQGGPKPSSCRSRCVGPLAPQTPDTSQVRRSPAALEDHPPGTKGLTGRWT